MRFIFFLLSFIFLVQKIDAKVVKYGGGDSDIPSRWEWAEEQSKGSNDNIWIGYSIKQEMEKNSRIGSWSQGKIRPTIAEILEREISADDQFKDVAFIFLIPNPAKPTVFSDLKIGTFDSEIDLQNYPLYWLGSATESESVSWLKKLYKIAHEQVKKELVCAFGLHTIRESTDELVKIVKTEKSGGLQKDAVFWLGQQGNAQAFDFLVKTVESHPSTKIRKAAVFSISQIESEDAVDAIIETAKSNSEYKVRKEAIFWLGQMAVKKSAESLKNIIYDESTIELKKHAVFSLSQMKDEQSVDYLINIAKEHPSLEVRKSAIFWLSETDNDKALEVLVGILREKR